MTAINIERHQEEMRHRQFEAYARAFFDRWQPKDPADAREFSAELFALVRQIYIDANGPANDMIKQIVACLPSVPLVFKS